MPRNRRNKQQRWTPGLKTIRERKTRTTKKVSNPLALVAFLPLFSSLLLILLKTKHSNKTTHQETSVIRQFPDEPQYKAKDQPSDAIPLLDEEDRSKFRIAYAIFVTNCSSVNSTRNGTRRDLVLDAPAVLAHSIRSMNSRYTMYDVIALVHPSAKEWEVPLTRVGYRVRPLEVRRFHDIVNFRLLENDGCHEALGDLMKLQVFNMTDYDAVVQLDTNTLMHKHMDHLLDAILLPYTSSWKKLKLLKRNSSLPVASDVNRIFVHDNLQQELTRKHGGFFLVKPNSTVLQLIMNSWKTKHDGGFTKVQDLLSYAYSEEFPGDTLEIDASYHNIMVFISILTKNNTCEYGKDTPLGECTGCSGVPLDQSQPAHYTACYEPWKCSDPAAEFCCHAHRAWFEARRDLELSWGHSVPKGGWRFNVTQGYCRTASPTGYIPMKVP